MTAAKLSLTMPSDREIQITRSFNAPASLVFEAWSKPKYLRRWLLGPPGWTMTACDVDLRVGGAYRYAWRKDDGAEMGMGGVYRDVKAPERIVATERFDESWYPGDALVTNVFAERAGVTTSTLTILYASKEARDIASQSGMSDGMEMGYARLDDLLAEEQV